MPQKVTGSGGSSSPLVDDGVVCHPSRQPRQPERRFRFGLRDGGQFRQRVRLREEQEPDGVSERPEGLPQDAPAVVVEKLRRVSHSRCGSAS